MLSKERKERDNVTKVVSCIEKSAPSLTWSLHECVGQLCHLVAKWWRCWQEPPSPLCCRAAGVQSAAAA